MPISIGHSDIACSLDRIGQDEEAVIAGYAEGFPASRRERFEDLGFLVGETVRRLYTATFGDPIAYHVRGSVLCLRNEDARHIRVYRGVR